jgi:hypothetical protein
MELRRDVDQVPLARGRIWAPLGEKTKNLLIINLLIGAMSLGVSLFARWVWPFPMPYRTIRPGLKKRGRPIERATDHHGHRNPQPQSCKDASAIFWRTPLRD